MPNEKPVISKDPMYQLLRVDNIKAFNIKKEPGQTCDMRGVNLRGIDFSQSVLRGASLLGAKISGCLFPPELTAEEIRLSHNLGTRLRYKND